MSPVKTLQLQYVRRFENFLLDLDPKLTLLMAPNGVGKSTVLEALYLGSTGQSPRTNHPGEMVKFGQELGRLAVLVAAAGASENKLGVTLTRGTVGGRRTSSRLFTLNESKKRAADFIGQYLAVIFRPEDMRLIEGSPGRRRDYLDAPLSVCSYEYAAALKTYSQALLRRNKLLTAIRAGEASADGLEYWDKILLENGQKIQDERRAYLEFINQIDSDLKFFAHYDHSLMTAERLAQYRQAEMACGHTLVGPHKDELEIRCVLPGKTQPVNIQDFGSRGQQRLAVLWLKLGELKFLEEKKADRPLLLLDDILSELDEEARELVLSLIPNYQTVMSTTEEAVVELVTNRHQVLKIVRLESEDEK